MCLHTVYKHGHEMPSAAIGLKVVYYSSENGWYRPAMVKSAIIQARDKGGWAIADNENEIFSATRWDNATAYLPGVHAYKSIESAKHELEYWNCRVNQDYNQYRIKKVLLRGPIAEGMEVDANGEHGVLVYREMVLLPDIE